MYWNNPMIKVSWPSQDDPIAQSLHNGQHCIFYDPAVHRNKIRSNQSLQDLCDWINARVQSLGWPEFAQDQRNHYEIANLVKLNMWVDSLAGVGNVKPMLLQYVGNPLFETGTGESRLRAMERLPQIKTCQAFISTHKRFADKFSHCFKVKTFDQFAQLCQAVKYQTFFFRLTDASAAYGLDWYEYENSLTSAVTPDTAFCVGAMTNYFEQHPDTVFSPEWFDTLINWSNYKSS
jgi:hypothetical protein